MATLQEIIDDFAFLEEWEDRYRFVIEVGKALPDLAEDKRTAANKVQGCASQVWLVSHVGDGADPVMTFEGDSAAHIVRGLVEHLSSQRANGLRSMIKRIREEAAMRVAA